MPFTPDQRRQLAAATRVMLRKSALFERATTERALVSGTTPTRIAEADRHVRHADALLDAAVYGFLGELEDLMDDDTPETAGGPPAAVAAGESAPGLTDGGAGTSAGPTVRGLTGTHGVRFA